MYLRALRASQWQPLKTQNAHQVKMSPILLVLLEVVVIVVVVFVVIAACVIRAQSVCILIILIYFLFNYIGSTLHEAEIAIFIVAVMQWGSVNVRYETVIKNAHNTLLHLIIE